MRNDDEFEQKYPTLHRRKQMIAEGLITENDSSGADCTTKKHIRHRAERKAEVYREYRPRARRQRVYDGYE